MTRRQLGDTLRTLLRESRYDMEASAETLIRMHVAGAELVPSETNPRETPENRCAVVIVDVAVERGVTVDKVKHGGRARGLVAIRHEAAWRCRQLKPTLSYPEIGRALGGMDHSSVIYAVRRHQRRLDAAAAARILPGGSDQR